MNAVAAVGWPRWPIHLVAGLVLIINLWLVRNLRQEAKQQSDYYLPQKTNHGESQK